MTTDLLLGEVLVATILKTLRGDNYMVGSLHNLPAVILRTPWFLFDFQG